MSRQREDWRIVVLVVLVLASLGALLIPGATVASGPDDAEDGPAVDEGVTNLQYGIQLDGGSRIRAPIVGNTTENVEVTRENADDVEAALVERFGIDRIDVAARPDEDTVEVFSRNVTREELVAALQDQGFDVSRDDARAGVTGPTRDEMVRVVDKKLQVSALSGATVREARTPTGRHFIVIEATGRDIDDLRAILEERGVVRVFAFYPAPNGTHVRDQVLTQSDFSSIGTVEQLQGQRFGVTVTLTDGAAGPYTQAMQDRGFTQATRCSFDRENPDASSGRCLLTTLNGEVVFAARVTGDLASSYRDGSFVNDPTFTMSAPSREQARNLELSLKAGAPLPAPLDFEAAQTTSLQPALAEQFKLNSLITGVIAVIAVSAVVYLRYRDVRVAAPMVVTALSEVVILLGFVAAIQFPLDLSHLAGFIAVIGTGVDDLIIIADEILQQEGVATGRVFQNRFRKAFWVIGAAAATTIIAMSPLTVLSLGDLSGFAIVTIIGVLIGVLITRPAYGDILRHLVLDEG